METESRMLVTRDRGGENGELGFHGYRISVWEDEKDLEMDSGADRTTV